MERLPAEPVDMAEYNQRGAETKQREFAEEYRRFTKGSDFVSKAQFQEFVDNKVSAYLARVSNASPQMEPAKQHSSVLQKLKSKVAGSSM